MKKGIIAVFFFGFVMAAIAVLLQFIEYRYYIGSLDTKIYTSVVAIIFTVIGVWIGINLLKRKQPEHPVNTGIDHKQLEVLNLNDREYEILKLIAKGHSNQEIADQLFLALPTIKTHTYNLYSKLDVRSRTQAVHKARTLNLI